MSLSDAATPTKDVILDELRSLMKSEFDLSPDRIQPSTLLIDDLDLDSIDLVDLAVALEESSGLRLEDEELKAVQTVEDAVTMVEAALARRNADSS